MLWLPILAWALASQAPAAPASRVSTITLKPATVIELDLGQLKGDLRQVGWSPDASQLYIQTVEGNPPKEKFHHYIVGSEGGALMPTDRQPEWARDYWAFKSDKSAPGIPTLEIDAKQGVETIKAGTGPAGVLDRQSSAAGANNINNIDAIAAGTDQYQKAKVWRFTLLDETISYFMNTRPIPGLMFSWGPRGSGTIAFTDQEGRLVFLDQGKHKVVAPGVKEATLPAWSEDGARIAYAVKEGRKKYQLVWCTITR